MCIKNKLLLAFLLVLLALPVFSRQFISGFVKDKITGEYLVGATVMEKNTSYGTSTNNQGYFNLVGTSKTIVCSYIGYETTEITIHSKNDTLLVIELVPGKEIDEVVVVGRKQPSFNSVSLTSKQMLQIPNLGGKPDVLKAIGLMPGIQTQVEGSSLMTVRGGDPGQNLYLIDKVPLIYVNHLGGFTSVFNPDMINDIEVYKGGFPAEFGGKLSSIVNISQKKGDISKRKGSLSIGVTDASFTIEGPLKGKKASYFVAGRKTMVEPLMYGASCIADGDYHMFYGFHDINAKVSWEPNLKNSFSFNLYHGDDYINYWNKENFSSTGKNSVLNIWGNWLGAARWSRVFSSRLVMDNSLSFTRYRWKIKRSYEIEEEQDTLSFYQNDFSSVSDLSLRSDWKVHIVKGWDIDFGGMATHLSLIPNKRETTNQELPVYDVVRGWETALYLNNKLLWADKLWLDLGARWVNHWTESDHYASLEPRLRMNWNFLNRQYLHFDYQKVQQFSHLVLTPGTILTNEVWVPVGKGIEPAISEQYSLGWKGYFADEMIEVEVDLYKKNMSQLSTFKEGYTNLMGDPYWRNKIVGDGEGNSRGIEFLLKKTQGHWTGFVSYAYSQTKRSYPTINNGTTYDYGYDRPHAFAMNVNRKINHKLNFNATWVFQSGIPFTPVVGKRLDHNLEEVLIYGERNSARMKNYHRLDLGLNYEVITKRKRKAVWTFSIYNAYNRLNPNAYFYDKKYDRRPQGVTENPTVLKQISFFPIIPSVSYKLYFEQDTEKIKVKKSFKDRIKNYLRYEN